MSIGGPKALPPVDAGSPEPVAVSVGAAQPGAATAALTEGAAPAPAATKRRATSEKRAYRPADGPGTPRYNLLLSLGGAY
jgi:hypothetical protein